MGTHTAIHLLTAIIVFSLVAPASEASRALPVVNALIRGAGKNIDETTRAADTRMVAAAMRRHGEAAVETALRSGGYGLLRATRAHGDDVLAAALRVPGSERLLAAEPAFFLRVVRRYGDDALRMETRLPGFLQTAERSLTPRQIRQVAAIRGPEQTEIARFIMLAENKAVAQAIVRTYNRQGPSFLSRISKTKVLTAGVVTAGAVDYAIREERSVIGRLAKRGEEMIADGISWLVIWILGALLVLFALKNIARWLLHKIFFDWSARRPRSEAVLPEADSPDSTNNGKRLVHAFRNHRAKNSKSPENNRKFHADGPFQQ